MRGNASARRIFATLALLAALVLPAVGEAGAAGADSAPDRDFVTPLEWQRVNLEDRLQDKLSKAIAPTVPDKHFVVSVSIKLKEKAKPVDGKAPGSEDNRINLGKLDLDGVPFRQDEEDLDLFKNIQKVTVSVLLDNSVPDAKKDVVGKIVKNLTESIGGEAPAISIDKIDLIPAEKVETWDLKRWALELKAPIGFLGATLIFCLAFLQIFGGYRKLESRKISILEARSAREEAAAQAVTAAAGADEIKIQDDRKDSHGAAAGAAIEGVQKGFDKFKTLLREAPEKASALIKQWIKAPARGSKEALVILPQILSTEEFLAIFKYLSLDDRKSWKKLLSGTVDQAGASLADAFVSAQIVESLLIPSPTMGDDLRKMLNELSLPECVELTTQDPALGALLVNLLPMSQVGRMYALMPAELANSLTVASLKCSDDEIQGKADALKAAITAIKSNSKTGPAAPFLEKAAELLQDVDPEKEKSIFAALAESGELKVLQAAAKQFFPAELLLKLPARVMKTCLERLPLTRRAELIYSKSDEDRPFFLDALGKAGSKVRDLLDVEIQQVQTDELRKRRVEKNRDAIWREFVDLTRGLVRSNESVSEQVEGVLNSWLSEMTNGQIGGADDKPADAA